MQPALLKHVDSRGELGHLCRDEILTYKRLELELGPEDFGKYVTLNKELLPEVFWEEGPPTWEQFHPKGGCPGLQVIPTKSPPSRPPFSRKIIYAHCLVLTMWWQSTGHRDLRLEIFKTCTDTVI